MTISISQVPPGTRTPGAFTNLTTSGAHTGLASQPDKLLLIGTKTASGTATAASPTQVYSVAEARTLFGSGSPPALMVAAALAQNPQISELWVCALSEHGSGVAAAGTLTITSSGLTAGVLTVYIGRFSVQISVAAADTNGTIASNIEAALDDDTSLPFTASVATNVVTLTAVTKGTQGNDWTFASHYTGSGLTVTIVQPVNGATNPTLSTALQAVLSQQYDLIVMEYNDSTSLDALITHLDDVSGAMEQRPGIGICGVAGDSSLSTATTLSSGRNSERLGLVYLRGTRTHPMELGAAVAAAFTAEPDRARPLNRVVIDVAEPPDTLSDRLSRAEQQSALSNGLMPLQVVGGDVQIVRSVSTYVTDSFGAADDTLLDLQTIRVLDAVRAAVNTAFRATFAQVKIADNAVTPNTTDPAKIRGVVLGVLRRLQDELGYLENVEAHSSRLVVERDGSDPGRVNISIPADIVDGLHVLASDIQLILS